MKATTYEQPHLFDQPVLTNGPSRVPCPTCCGSGIVRAGEALAYMPGMVSDSHPETSKKAARAPSNVVRFGTQRHRALEALREGPMTAAQVADKIKVSRNQTATRLLELHRGGLVKYLLVDGKRLTRSTGQNDEGLVHELTLAGHFALTGAEG